MAADREHQAVVVERSAVGETKLAPGGVDARDRIAEHQFAARRFVERRRADRQALGFQFAGQEFLGKRRALVGERGFRADQHHAAGEAVLAQAVHDLRGRVAAAGDDDRVRHALSRP